jgi:hypothetical protein
MATVKKSLPLDGSGAITQFQKYVNKMLRLSPELNSVKSVEIGPVSQYSRMADFYSNASNQNPNITIEDVMWRATMTDGSIVVRCTSCEITARNRWLTGITQYVVGSVYGEVLTANEKQHKAITMKNIPVFALRRAFCSLSSGVLVDTYETISSSSDMDTDTLSVASWKRFYNVCPRDVLEAIDYFLVFCSGVYPRDSIYDDGIPDGCHHNPITNIAEQINYSDELPVVPVSTSERFVIMRRNIRNAVKKFK